MVPSTGTIEYALKKKLVFSKGQPIQGLNESEWRLDAFGNLLKYKDHGDRTSPFGWEMDHHPTPKFLGGSDEVWNLRPLRCALNAFQGGVYSSMKRGGLFGLLGKP